MVRLTTPRLKGLGWLGAAFASGGVGAALLALPGRIPQLFSVVLADLLVLSAFVLLHVAILDTKKAWRRIPALGVALMGVQTTALWQMTFLHPNARGRSILIGFTVSIQAVQTVVVLVRGAKRGVRMPVWFNASILLAVMGLSLFRSMALIAGQFQNPVDASAMGTLTFLVYIAMAMGIAFGFFWMTTAELSTELEFMASTDPLTRIYNRRVFRDWCERELARSRESGIPFSLLMMDLDHFKQINDRFGHHGGDQMLCAVVEKMQDSIRGIDILGRWGGEEFVALLPGASAEAAVLVAQRVRKNIENLLLNTQRNATWKPEETMRMTVSLGVATYRGAEDELDGILHRADEALYKAKAAGRNQVLAMA